MKKQLPGLEARIPQGVPCEVGPQTPGPSTCLSTSPAHSWEGFGERVADRLFFQALFQKIIFY